jgi:hypothetical protein
MRAWVGRWLRGASGAAGPVGGRLGQGRRGWRLVAGGGGKVVGGGARGGGGGAGRGGAEGGGGGPAGSWGATQRVG